MNWTPSWIKLRKATSESVEVEVNAKTGSDITGSKPVMGCRGHGEMSEKWLTTKSITSALAENSDGAFLIPGINATQRLHCIWPSHSNRRGLTMHYCSVPNLEPKEVTLYRGMTVLSSIDDDPYQQLIGIIITAWWVRCTLRKGGDNISK